METRANYAAVGAFVLAMVVLAIGAVIWLAGGQINAPQAHYRIYFSGLVSGLREGAAVEYNGVPVGKVEEVRIDPDNVALVRTTITTDPMLVIKRDAVATLQSNLLSGVSFIQISGGTQDAPPLKPEGNERYPVIRSVPSTLASVAASGPELIDKLNATVDRFSTLLDEKNRQALSESLESLRAFTAGLAQRNDDLAELAGNANAATAAASKLLVSIERSYTGSDGIGTRLTTAITDFDKVARNLLDTNKQLQGALSDVQPGLRSFSQRTLTDVGNLIAETRQLVASANRVVTTVERDPMSLLFGDRREGYKPR
jgi:phospholipid/cholesterol/gamma-HCH transport system substrate-binding protein